MKFKLSTASGRGDVPSQVEINTLDDLKKLYDSAGCPLIVDFEPNVVTIYDDYME